MISFSFKNLKFTQIIRKLEDLANFLKHILVDNIFYLAFPFLIFTATYCSNPFEYKLYSSSYFLLSSYRKSFCLKRLPESFPYHKNLKIFILQYTILSQLRLGKICLTSAVFDRIACFHFCTCK